MPLEEEISDAIAFHYRLKDDLRTALATGRSHHTVAGLCRDDRCRLGQWLHGLDESIKVTPRWQCVRGLHADFHREAAAVLEAALGGGGTTSRRISAYSSSYTGIARRFENELRSWKREAANQLAVTRVRSSLPTEAPTELSASVVG